MTVCWHILQLRNDISDYGDESKISLNRNRNLASFWRNQSMERQVCSLGQLAVLGVLGEIRSDV